MSEELEVKFKELQSRVRNLEKVNETLVDEVIDQVLSMFSTTNKVYKYIPDIKRIEEDFKMFKKDVD